MLFYKTFNYILTYNGKENIPIIEKKFSNKEIKYATNFVNKLYRSYGGKEKIKIKQEKIENNILAKTNLKDKEIVLNALYHDFIIENFNEVLLHQITCHNIYLKNFLKKYFSVSTKNIFDLLDYEIFFYGKCFDIFIENEVFQNKLQNIREKIIDIICAKINKNYYNFFIKINRYKYYGYKNIQKPGSLAKDLLFSLNSFSKNYPKNKIIEEIIKYCDCNIKTNKKLRITNKKFSKEEIKNIKKSLNQILKKIKLRLELDIVQRKMEKNILASTNLITKEFTFNIIYHDFIIKNLSKILLQQILYHFCFSLNGLMYFERTNKNILPFLTSVFFSFPFKNKNEIEKRKEMRRKFIYNFENLFKDKILKEN
ncbi:MAG: hypothetical protein QXF15_03105 [Candidatus Aenigmatarchaeota archaeon]